jgi:hypothetical protein
VSILGKTGGASDFVFVSVFVDPCQVEGSGKDVKVEGTGGDRALNVKGLELEVGREDGGRNVDGEATSLGVNAVALAFSRGAATAGLAIGGREDSTPKEG